MFKLSSLESKYPCFCGHQEARHGKTQGNPICWQCYDIFIRYSSNPDVDRNKMVTDTLHEYKADNLRYLEEKLKAYEKRSARTKKRIQRVKGGNQTTKANS